jgi:hypothetical protein
VGAVASREGTGGGSLTGAGKGGEGTGAFDDGRLGGLEGLTGWRWERFDRAGGTGPGRCLCRLATVSAEAGELVSLGRPTSPAGGAGGGGFRRPGPTSSASSPVTTSAAPFPVAPQRTRTPPITP